MTSRVLSISMRPENLEEFLCTDTVEIVKKQFESKRIPHFFLLVGESGSGKTTLARIITMKLQNTNIYNTSKYDIKEINGSDKNGVDDVRQILNTINFKPMGPSLAKVIIIDEAHQLTTAAQNALLKDTEDTPEHVYFILCTNNDSKILAALKRRAYIIQTKGLSDDNMHKLLLLASKKAGYEGSIDELEKGLIENGIRSPGLILQAAEKYFSGSKDYVSTIEGQIDTRKFCNLMVKGDWVSLIPMISIIKKEDIFQLRNCILGYLKAVLLNTGITKYSKISEAMLLVSQITYDTELPVFMATICSATMKMRV